jgi:hypothetical protein
MTIAASSYALDDARVGTGEILWRLIPSHWYRADPNDTNRSRLVMEAAFSGEVSVLRQTLVSETLVDSVYNGRFSGVGILELSADDLRNRGFVFEHEHDPEWGTEAHFLLRRVGVDGATKEPKFQRLNQTQKVILARLASTKPLLREPK